MKIAIIGAGAIGGYVGARFALAGEDVTFMVRGANLQALRANGIRLITADGLEQVARQVKASDDYAATGVQDLVILAMKAHQVQAVLPQLHHLVGPGTVIVPMQNGIPFWYFHEHGPHAGTVVRSVDPEGALLAGIPVAQVLGCVVYPASELPAPGVVKHVEGDRFPLGELDGSRSERVLRIAAAFERAGFKSPVLEDIRAEIWLKLWGNLTFNPISALSHATLVDICQFQPTRDLAAAMMAEAADVAGKLGISFRVSLEKRIAGAEKVGRHKTSMLQDVENGRALELQALVGAVIELGRITGVATPTIAAIYAATALLGQTVLGQGGRLRVEKGA